MTFEGNDTKGPAMPCSGKKKIPLQGEENCIYQYWSYWHIAGMEGMTKDEIPLVENLGREKANIQGDRTDRT